MDSLSTKTCTVCKNVFPLSKFYKSDKGRLKSSCATCCSIRNKKAYLKNKDKRIEANKKWAEKNKTRIQETKIRRKFGIGLKEKQELFERQGSCCAICKCKSNVRERDWDVDHCHETGVVRGILCSNCNRALGLFQDNAEYLQNAAEYLKNKRKKEANSV